MQPKAAASLVGSTIPSLPHRAAGVLLVHTDAPHRLHPGAGADTGPVVWAAADGSFTQDQLLAACSA